MGFFLTPALIAAAAALLSAAISFAIFRLRKPHAKPVAVVLGLVLFVVLAIGGVFLLMIESLRRSQPF